MTLDQEPPHEPKASQDLYNLGRGDDFPNVSTGKLMALQQIFFILRLLLLLVSIGTPMF